MELDQIDRRMLVRHRLQRLVREMRTYAVREEVKGGNPLPL